MRQCMRCGKACQATFCDDCQSFLQGQLHKDGVAPAEVSTYDTAPLPAMNNPVTPFPPLNDSRATLVEHSTQTSENNPVTPFPPLDDTYAQQAERALQNLRDAARRIAAVERNEHRALHASRLSPLRDISADIQRKSTSLPRMLSKNKREEIEDLGDVPNLWALFSSRVENGELENEGDEEREGEESWESAVDPLVSRQFPRRAEVARIEEADLKRAVSDGLATTAQMEIFKRLQAKQRLRWLFVCVALVALVVLIVDIVLVAFVLWRGSGTAKLPLNQPPTFTLSSTVVTYGQSITVSIRNFPPSTPVYLTHDVNEPVMTKQGKSILQIEHDGSAQASMSIDAAWEPGFHTLQAEDMKTRYTASVTLRVNEGSMQRPHFTLSARELDLGAGAQGGNTEQPVVFHNSGSGAIAWVASSNQPWLQITPAQGTFSSSQTVIVGGQRTNLPPGDYKGVITISSHVSAPVTITVKMTVHPLPVNVGAALAIVPAVLSYTAIDGGRDPSAQPLTISNPGKQPLYWSLSGNVSKFEHVNILDASMSTATAGAAANWLGADHASGVVAPGKTATIQVLTRSGSLMPGTYLGTLVFGSGKGSSAYNAPQSVSISLTVQQRCSLALNTGNLTFTAVAGQGNPTNQALNLSADTSCPGLISWKATSAARWVTMTPASGQLKGTSPASMSVGINISSVSKPDIYTTNLSITTGQSTQSVMVQLTLQKQPMPTAPIMSAAPLNLNFAANQGQSNLPGQTVTIANSGHSPLQWHSTINSQVDPWLTTSPAGGTIPPGQTGQMTVYVNPGPLAPGNYVAQIQLNSTDVTKAPASGSPQTIAVNLQVSASCVLAEPSSSALAFNATQGGNDPAAQTLSITASGNCNWPLSWNMKGVPSWLKLSPSSGLLTASNPSATITVAPSIAGLSTNQSAQVSVSLSDSSNGQVQGSPASFDVSLTLQQPCSVKIALGSIAFTSVQDQSSIPIQASNVCSSINWQATANDGGEGWLSVDTSNSGDGSIIVMVDGSKLAAGTYTGSVAVTASDSSGEAVQGGSQTVSVSLKIPAATFTVGGTVYACADNSCSSSQPLGGAQVTLTDSSGQQVKSTTADSSGNFSFSNVPAGSYTIASSGTDSSNVSYAASKEVSVSSNQQVTIQAIAT